MAQAFNTPASNINFASLLIFIITLNFIEQLPPKGGQRHIIRISRRDGQVLLEAAGESQEVQSKTLRLRTWILRIL